MFSSGALRIVLVAHRRGAQESRSGSSMVNRCATMVRGIACGHTKQLHVYFLGESDDRGACMDLTCACPQYTAPEDPR